MTPAHLTLIILILTNACIAINCKSKSQLNKAYEGFSKNFYDKITKNKRNIGNGKFGMVYEIDWPIKDQNEQNKTKWLTKNCVIKGPNIQNDQVEDLETYVKLQEMNELLKWEIDFFQKLPEEARLNFPEFIDCYYDRDVNYYFVMEKFDFSLDEFVKVVKENKQSQATKAKFSDLPVGAKFLYLKSMMENVLAIHKQGRLHNDIKPENFVGMTNDIKTRLIDFGLASFIDDLGSGTPCYYHPLKLQYHWYRHVSHNEEKMLNLKNQILKNDQRRFDVWSLGLTFIILVDPDLLDLIKKTPTDAEDIKKRLNPLFDKINSEEWIKDNKLDLCTSKVPFFKVCLKDIILEMVNKKEQNVKGDLEALLKKMDDIYKQNSNVIESGRVKYEHFDLFQSLEKILTQGKGSRYEYLIPLI